ncbi:MAG: sulfotransferase [Planctomycetales bacterium]|nr:sulfotransferase [Planctomycetales bacterium]
MPDFLVAGAQKAGTTSLWEYLSEHPHVRSPMKKEMMFFDKNFSRGLNWYRMHFPFPQPGTDGATACGESTAYYMFHPLAPQRIAEALPGVRIVLLLRNPADRAFSHYQLNLRRGNEHLSFEDALKAEPGRLAGERERLIADPSYYSFEHERHSYLARGRYAEQLRVWQSLISRERLLILDSSNFFKNTAEVFDRVADFLGLPRWRPREFGNRFPGEYQAKMNEATRQWLIDYFRPHNAKLYELLGRDFSWEQRTRQRAA